MTSHPISISEALITLKECSANTKKFTNIYNETKNYLENFAKITDKHATEDLRQNMADNQFTDYEIAIIGSLLPTKPHNIKELVPTLERISDDVIYKLANLISDHCKHSNLSV